MNSSTFIKRQITQIRQGGGLVMFRKMKLALQLFPKFPLYILAIPAVLVIRLIRQWLLVRIGGLVSSRIGHFAANTEQYLCERDADINKPIQRHVDIFYLVYKPTCNKQLTIMWKRVLHIWPTWLMTPIAWINRMIPGGAVHEVGNNTQRDRDVHNLLDRFPTHLKFTPEEEAKGLFGMCEIGIPVEKPFVCLLVRDSAYLEHRQTRDYNYHNYRDCNIDNYVLASEELAQRGYYVIRMGVKVHSALISRNPMVIDYATNGMRSDFMDIYLGAKCHFCISTSSGWDSVPMVFRKPILYVPIVPIGYFSTFCNKYIGITKHHIDIQTGKELVLNEILGRGVGFSLVASKYETKGVRLIENTPEEIRDSVIEMDDRLKGKWEIIEGDDKLQKRFWEIFPTDTVDANGIRLHGKIHARFGMQFLRNNPDWLS